MPALAAAQEGGGVLLPRLTPERETPALQQLPLDDWRRLESLPLGAELRVSLERAQVFKGKLEDVTGEALTLRLRGGGLKVVHSWQVVRIHEVHRDSILDGTLIGLGVGASVGAIIGAAQDPESTDLNRLGGALFGAMIGVGPGGLVGFLVDNARLEMVVVYERPTPGESAARP
ncbi:hypothetical protein MYX77_08595 [Acidobacteriia bacterium AH_259_A11_L15]|nr:hypothetical protein [Acidobacteriia bacterium AH_259_A11_L15]